METTTATKPILKKSKDLELIGTLRRYAMKGKEIDIKILREKLRKELGTTSLSADLINERRKERI